MPWEKRGLQQFYYRSQRVNGRVIKKYLGTGYAAQQAYEIDQQRQEEKKQERAMRKEIEALDHQTNSLWNMTKTLVKAHLLVAGYHQHHRGEWRKRRIHNNTHEGDTNMVPQIQGPEKLSLEDLNAIIDRAMTGDESTLPTIKQWLDVSPA